MYGNANDTRGMRRYYQQRADAIYKERAKEAAARKAQEQAENPLCVLCDAPATHESPAGIGWVCDSDHPELD